MFKNFFANPFIVGAIFFILCVIFEIHGSSINIYRRRAVNCFSCGDIRRSLLEFKFLSCISQSEMKN